MEVSAYKADGIFAKELEDELMKFTVKSEDNGGVEEPPLVNQTDQKNNEVEVNITECTKSMGNKAFIPQHQDSTESEGSSSFDDSDSDFENFDSLGNSEALSGFCGDIDGFGDNFSLYVVLRHVIFSSIVNSLDSFDRVELVYIPQKKKLTAHWRSFIQPIMWRCKWTELQIKKLQSLAQKYDRELEAHNKRKQIQLEDTSLEDGVKSVPFSRTTATDDLFKRKKRRMKEATTDVAEYMSRHNLFSYYENKKSSIDGASMSNLSKSSAAQKANIDEEVWTNDDLSTFVAGDGDNSLEEILRKIELLQSQAGQLRSRVNRVIQGNAEKFHFVDELLPMPFEAPTASNGDGMAVGTYIASQLMSEYNMGDLHASESEVTNHGEGVHNANASTDHAPFADSYRNVEDGALIDNQRVKEEINFEEVIINPSQKPPLKTIVPVNTISPQLASEPNLPANNRSSPKVRSVSKTTAPRTKRKRGWKKGVRRKPRRSTGS
ncbi:hypothetical protein STAS_07152 [Striga asiatica]|uniref:Uncharacterized protein n=1 Tax=Striga asiatica TaxID=4170 RepID=A0A5A7PF33_STRAF|nr:hypothetical protein STAS_07152 [Striga asiatica]